MTATITRPTCSDCWFWVVGQATDGFGECRYRAPTPLKATPRTQGTYWCGRFVAPPADSIVNQGTTVASTGTIDVNTGTVSGG